MSEYEKIMGTAADMPGRGSGAEVVFSTHRKNKELCNVARRRALLVLKRRHLDELRDIFESEYDALESRLKEEIAREDADAETPEERRVRLRARRRKANRRGNGGE